MYVYMRWNHEKKLIKFFKYIYIYILKKLNETILDLNPKNSQPPHFWVLGLQA